MSDLRINQSHIESGVLINTLLPVETFTLYWRVSNFSRIYKSISAEFSTKSKVTTWRVVLDIRSGGYAISLVKTSQAMSVRVRYTAEAKTCHNTLRNTETYEFGNNSMIILIIPCIENTPNKKQCRTRFENDVLNFKCTMEIIGHSITNTTLIPSPLQPSISQLSSDFQCLLKSEHHCDMVVSVGKAKFHVHKAILCARSPVFNVMFQHDMMENKNQEVEVDDIDTETFREFVSFLYLGKVEVLTLEKAMKLYYAADKYEVADLRKACSGFLQFNMTVEDVCTVLKLADQHKDDELKGSAAFFIKMNMIAVRSTDEWKDLLTTNPKLVTEVQI